MQDQVYKQLRQAIYSGRLKPGDKLVERKLALEFATSRVPLRESLLRLTSEGLVRRSHRKTSYVEDMTEDDVREICLMRMALEPLATRLAAEQSDRRFTKRLSKLVDRMVRQFERGNLVAASETDLAFHKLIVKASQSPRLIRAYETMHLPLIMSRLPEHSGISQLMRQVHTEITRQIELGNAAEAERVAREHLEETTHRVLAALSSMSKSSEDKPEADSP